MSNQVANEMARKKAEDLLSPLLEAEARPDDDGSAASAATNELEQRTPLQKLKTLAGACPRPSRPPSSPSPRPAGLTPVPPPAPPRLSSSRPAGSARRLRGRGGRVRGGHRPRARRRHRRHGGDLHRQVSWRPPRPVPAVSPSFARPVDAHAPFFVPNVAARGGHYPGARQRALRGPQGTEDRRATE